MSKQPSKPSKKLKRDNDSDTEDSDDDLQPVHFFVPGENINAAVLVEYITQYVDRTARITSSHHPTDKSRTGFTVLAKKTLNAVSLRDIINDSRDWDLETQSRTFRKDPYRYSESDTARRRARLGASKGGASRPAARQQRQTSIEPTEAYRRERPSGPSGTSNAPAQYPSYQTSQPQEFPRSTSGHHPTLSRPDYVSNTYNIYNTMASTTYSANAIPSTGGYTPGQYASVGYAAAVKPTHDYPPPPYEPSNAAGPPRPQPPSQPDPDAFDALDKPRTSQPMDMASLRPGASPAGEEPSRPYSSQARRPSAYDEMTRRSSHRG